ncbi:hypothetical protein SHKM778_77310 [Streptomyces sp. KM77-8]|uniref:Uncharacterized protein n=1 Tax=Streptomyces haneummycinicus TaxID=3074435 RepID=A0AAT9HVG8_9ACTN
MAEEEEEECGDDYTLGTTTAQITRVGPDEVEILDFYGQFEDCRMSAHEFESVLGQVACFLGSER